MPHSLAQLFISTTTGIKGFFTNWLFPLLAALSIVLVLWGITTIITAETDDQHDEGKHLIIFGIIGFLAAALLWTLFYFTIAS